jgi:2-octaprenyl-6-methoxyphenol hydroxylase
MTESGSVTHDVVIVGAGMVGASLALALLHDNPRPLRVLLVEASAIHASPAPAQPGFDIRSTVLSAGSVAYFRTLGLWSALQQAAEPITQIHVSDQGRFGSVRLRAEEEGVDALGHVVENAALGRAMNAALLAASGLELLAPAKVTRLLPTTRGMQVQLQQDGSDTTVEAGLVVLAEGGRSGLCAQLGISHQHHSYRQGAVIANVAFTQPHQGIAYERFTAKGPLALLPLAAHEGQPRAALVWTHPLAQAADVMALDDEVFLAQLQQDFGQRVGVFTRVGKRAMYPLALQVAQEQVRPGLVLLGNVAHSLHPVAGQGFNLALRDAMTLAGNVRDSQYQGNAPGSFARLAAYQQAVRQDQSLTIGFSDYMTRLFSSNSAALALARKLGMASIDLLPPLKHRLSWQAMGLGHARVVLR